MSTDFVTAAADYITQRRARGYKLEDEGVLLRRFAEALRDSGVEKITTLDALAFAQRQGDVSLATQARRLGVIRAFANWLRVLDPTAAEPIPTGLIRGGYERVNPYLHSPAQVVRLMDAARGLPDPALAEAMYVLIGLLYVTGLRSGEAFALDVTDFDPARLLLVVNGKFDRKRLVPLHPSSVGELETYCGGRTGGPLFVGRSGKRVTPNAVHAAFRQLVATCGLSPDAGARHPRLHDFRHTLAVDSLVEAHRRGLDIDARVAVLSTFLGHKEPANTYWYLTASPELMSAVSDRMAGALSRRSR